MRTRPVQLSGMPHHCPSIPCGCLAVVLWPDLHLPLSAAHSHYMAALDHAAYHTSVYRVQWHPVTARRPTLLRLVARGSVAPASVLTAWAAHTLGSATRPAPLAPAAWEWQLAAPRPLAWSASGTSAPARGGTSCLPETARSSA